mmetsp:Transcript_21748/g.39227  ORF Transcript_21748/g.39227 Transcript_21748/m.39227 type:complete len:350 (-) Transcript_21748:1509-2558(-)
MAVTNQRNVTSRPVIEDPDGSPSDKLLRKRSTTSDSDSDYEYGSQSKHTGVRTQSRKIKNSRSISSVSNASEPNFDAKAYLDKRVMTPMQERFNAITMIPGMIYSIYFIFAGCWMATSGSDQQGNIQLQQNESSEWADIAREAFGNEHDWIENIGCINSQAFPYLKALPPLPVVAAAFSGLLHSSCSVLYHYKCATTIEPSKRIKHWSRRLDHASIHFSAACASYATSGRMDYFLLNAAFNLDCGLRQIEEKVQPRRNLVRIAMSILFYILPVLVHGDYAIVFQFFVMFAVGGWLFVQYPVGGWSHSLFHLVLTFLPYLVIASAMQLESTQLQITLAAKCAGVPPVDHF